MKAVNLAEKLAQFTTHWDPHVVADYNDNEVMVARTPQDTAAFPFEVQTQDKLALQTCPTALTEASFPFQDQVMGETEILLRGECLG